LTYGVVMKPAKAPDTKPSTSDPFAALRRGFRIRETPKGYTIHCRACRASWAVSGLADWHNRPGGVLLLLDHEAGHEAARGEGAK